MVCDVLTISACMGSLLATKLNGIKTVGVVTDIPAYASINDFSSNKVSLSGRVNEYYISKFDSYVLLTEQMNPVVNTKSRPYIVMEGVADSSVSHIENRLKDGTEKKVVLYAGGLFKIYGLDKLVDAFRNINRADIQLSLFGSGSYVDELKEIASIDKRVVYYGVQPNDVIVQAEKEATILVNPRPTAGDFTKYSFPSKNMEYMVSGTPILTTRLPGIPKDYFPYIYTIDSETVDGYKEALLKVLELPKEELINKGALAQRFVLENKNNITQATRIIKLINSI